MKTELRWVLVIANKSRFYSVLTTNQCFIIIDIIFSYCWISQTFLIPSAFNKKVGVEVPHPGVDNSRNLSPNDRKYYAYYQWVYSLLF